MKKNAIKIPILSAAALITLITSGCAQLNDTETVPVTESTSKQTQSETVTSASAEKEETASAVSEKKKESKKNKKKNKKSRTETEETAAAEPVAEFTDSSESTYNGLLKSLDDLEIYDTDGGGINYEFIYDGTVFEAIYTPEPENWKIIDSYRISSLSDMRIICTALSELHPIHGSDHVSYRTPEDMAYEWEQHNLAYSILPKNNSWKENAKDVDLDPEDQGKSLYELYRSRTGGDISSAG